MNPPLFLASTSKYRKALLDRLGLAFEVEGPGVDEESVQGGSLGPEALAATLAAQKADAVSSRHPAAVVIGSDQVCACDGRVLNKPGDAATAREHIGLLSGRAHQLHTAVRVCRGGQSVDFQVTATLTMRKLDPQEIARYVDHDKPFDCAGSYKLERQGIALFESVVCADHTAIEGLPLIGTLAALRRFGFKVP